MSADALLTRLENVRQTGPGRWLARCPGHDDRRASLSIRENDDGRVLVHDFAGCSVHEIVSSVGLDLAALFPPKAPEAHAVKGLRRRVSASDALRAVSFEADLVAICAGRLGNGEPLTDGERARLITAASRIGAALLEAGCHG